jgi:hypothetical protein
MEKTIKTVGDKFLGEMADIVRPLGGVDMLHIDNDVRSIVDDAHEANKEYKTAQDKDKELKAKLRKLGSGTHYGFESVAIVGEDEDVESALNTSKVKELLLNLVIDGTITREQHVACFKDKTIRKGKVTFEDREE